MFKIIASAIISVALFFGPAVAGEMDWQEGLHYHAITPAPPPNQSGEIEVTEFFWYGCPHCFQFEPHLNKWIESKPDGVTITRIPVLFGGAADLHARAYYALEVMGELERLHEPLFNAMQVQKMKLGNQSELEDWLKTQDVDIDKFRAAMTSFAVSAKYNRAGALMRRYGVRSVPALVTDGRYRSGSGFQGYDDVIEVTNYLVDKIRNTDAAAAAAATN